MGSTTVRANAAAPAYIGYRCSSCGKPVITFSMVSAQGEAWHPSSWCSEEVKENLKAMATSKAKEKLEDKKATILREAQEKHYSTLAMPKCKCQQCGKTEPWMVGLPGALKKTIGIFGVAFVPLLIVGSIVTAADYEMLGVTMLYAAAACFGLFVIGTLMNKVIPIISNNRAQGKIQNLPENVLPYIAFDVDEFISAASERYCDAENLSDALQVLSEFQQKMKD